MMMIRNLWLLAAMFAGPCSAVLGASPVVTVTPNVVSNTYIGPITLQISSLTAGTTVVVQKYLDANTNGIVDGGDMLVQQFTLTDGQAGMVVGAVTNYNVPGDSDGAVNGSVTANLSFHNGDFIQNLVGNYLYKVSGNFAPPVTNTFSVTNFPFAQKFTGNVVSNGTSTTLSNAIIVLFPPPRPGHNDLGQPLGGMVANNAGAYSFMVPAGTYTLVAFKTNYVFNAKKAPVITLGSSQIINTNLTLTNATTAVTGKFVDAATNAIGLPGIFLPLQNTNGMLMTTTTDTNGNFTARVIPGQWNLGSDDSGFIVHGYVGSNNGTNVNNGANVTMPYPKANALFYGSVKDNTGKPVAGLDINAYDTASNLYQMDGYTDANGNYYVGVLGGLGVNDTWQISIGGDGAPTNFVFSQPQLDQNGATNISVGQALLVNFSAILATNAISGNVKVSNGNNIAGVGVGANANIRGTNYQAYADTDSNGNFLLNLPNGAWNLFVDCNDGSDSLSQIGNYACPNNINLAINGNNVVTNFVVQVCGSITIITPSPLPVGEVNVYYDQFLQASSCNGNFNWSVLSGTPPPWLNLNSSSGEVFGVPTNAGTYTVTMQVADQSSLVTNRQFSISFSNALQITTTSLLNGTNGLNYGQQLQGTAGVPFGGVPYSWALSGGSLPPNLNLATNGIISGMAAASGAFNFTVQAMDALGGFSSQSLSITIVSTNAPPLSIGTANGQAIVLWPASAGTNFTLLTATNLAGPWVPATNGVPQNAFIFSNTAPDVFFRLQ